MTVYDMKLHDYIEIKDGLYGVLRVPGGWLYNGVFVPYSTRVPLVSDEVKEANLYQRYVGSPKEIGKELLRSDQWIDDISRTKNRPRVEVVKYLKEFIGNQLLMEGLTSLKESKRHFINWLNKQQGSGKDKKIYAGISLKKDEKR